MSEELSFEAGNARLKSLFPPEIEFEGPGGKLGLEFVRGPHGNDLILSLSGKDIEVQFPAGEPGAAERALKALHREDTGFEEYLQVITGLPREIHPAVLRATGDVPGDSIGALRFLRGLFREGPRWLDGTLWLVSDNNFLLAVKPQGTRRARVSATSLSRHNGRTTLRKFSLEGVKPENLVGSWTLKQVPRPSFEAAAEALQEEGHGKVAVAIRCAAAYRSREARDGYFEKLKDGLSEEGLRELKRKAENVRERRNREERYSRLYEEFRERRYRFLPDGNELLLHPRCVASFGGGVELRKIESDKLEYHIGSRIRTGRWPPSVEFEPRDEFYAHEVKKLRESIKKAVDGIPDGPADGLRAYAVDWVLSEKHGEGV